MFCEIDYLAVDDIWFFGDTLALGASASQTFHITTQRAVDSIVTPTVTTDYVVTAGSVAAFTATKVAAQKVDITITAGAGGVTLDGPGGSTTGPQVRATILAPGYREVARQTAAPSSVYANRRRSLLLNDAGVLSHISQPSAQALVDAAANYYSEGRPTISLEIMNRDAARVDQMITRDISDRITIHAGSNEFNGDAWIEQLNYSITEGGRIARLGIATSRASVGAGYVENPALWDEAAWDEGVWGN
jgi:hypothetical protein